MKNRMLASLLAFASAGVYAQQQVSELAPLAGEKWYGAYTAKAFCNTPLKDLHFQPYLPTEQKKDLATENRGNQAAPVLISTAGRYVWSDDPFAFALRNDTLVLYSKKEKLQAAGTGKSLREAYVAAKDAHFPASGKTPHPLMFKLPQYNTWIELGTNQNQRDVVKYAANVLKNGFPAGVFMIDDGWAKDYGNFEFNPSTFPDPKGMMDTLHRQGFKVMLWLTPFISADGREYKELSQKHALLLKQDSKAPALVKWWNGYSACLDLTKPAAVDWLRGQLKSLQVKYGIDGFKFDAADFDFYSKGSRIFPNEESNSSGPVQAELYGKLGAEFDFNEFRAGWKNGNQPIAQRLQDKQYSWDDLTLLVPDMVSAGLIGQPFTCPDMIGGGLLSTFENIDYSKFDQELMVRSAQVQALMPMMQFSVAPWRVLDSAHLRLCREAALLHARMGDYILGLARAAAKDGEPIVRHMEYMFPGEGFASCDDQYMLGDTYLVAPQVTKANSRAVKLPKGKWTDDLGKKYKGGQTVKMDVPLNRLVYFTREM